MNSYEFVYPFFDCHLLHLTSLPLRYFLVFIVTYCGYGCVRSIVSEKKVHCVVVDKVRAGAGFI